MNMKKTFEIELQNQNKTIELPMATDQCLLHIFFFKFISEIIEKNITKFQLPDFFFVEMKKNINISYFY